MKRKAMDVYKCVIPAIKTIQDWFLDVYGLEVTRSQAATAAINMTASVSDDTIKAQRQSLFPIRMQITSMRIGIDAFKKLSKMQTEYKDTVASTRVELLSILIMLFANQLPTPTTSPNLKKMDMIRRAKTNGHNYLRTQNGIEQIYLK